MDNNHILLQVQNVDFSFRKNHVLDHINFDIYAGESIAILGSNGSGKSTLLSILSGSRTCRGASVLYNGTDLLKDRKMRGKVMGYVPQSNPLIPELSILDNLLLWYPGSKQALLTTLERPEIAMLGIGDYLNKTARECSGGMKKRAGIAIALLRDPDILLMDEPAAALDLEAKAELIRFLKTYLSSPGKTILLSTHDENELDVCTTLYALKQSKLELLPKDIRGAELIRALHK